MKKNKTKILLYDIEVSYTVGATWGLYEQNVAAVLREPYMISFSYKWLGESKVHVYSLPNFPLYKKDKRNDKALVEKLRELFDQADVIIAHNGNGFDQKWSYGRFAIHKIKPPSPSKYVDTLLVAKNKFKFNSNRLNDLGKYFGIGQKIDTGGIDLWVNCIEKDDAKSWALMEKYNKQDVLLLEKVYLHILPYITSHPNVGLMDGKIHACPNCGSEKLQKRGVAYTRVNVYQRFQCQSCYAWSQSPKQNKQVR